MEDKNTVTVAVVYFKSGESTRFVGDSIHIVNLAEGMRRGDVLFMRERTPEGRMVLINPLEIQSIEFVPVEVEQEQDDE